MNVSNLNLVVILNLINPIFSQNSESQAVIPSTPIQTGKILFSSDRNGTGKYEIWQSDEDFTNPVLKQGLSINNMLYPTWGKNLLKDEYIFQDGQLPKVFKESTSIKDMSDFLSTPQSAYSTAWSQSFYNFNASLGLNDIIDTLGYDSYSATFTYANLDTENKENSLYYVYGYSPLPFVPLIQSPDIPYYWNSQRKWIESHPTNPDLILVSNVNIFGINSIYEWNKTTNALSTAIYSTEYNAVDSDIKHLRYNSDGTKIGFTANTSLGANPHAFICDIDGTNLIDLGANIEFCAFGNLASEPDIIVLFNRYEFSVTHNASFWRVYSKNLTTDVETNLSGDVAYNDYSCDWKL